MELHVSRAAHTTFSLPLFIPQDKLKWQDHEKTTLTISRMITGCGTTES